MQVDDAAYVSLTGQKPGTGANVSAKTDSMDELSLLAKSTSWMAQLRGAYNKIAKFAEANREFMLFDWVKATQSDVDFVLSYFLVWLTPTEDDRALGTRFTPDSLKQLKTGIKNVLTMFLKRCESFDQDHSDVDAVIEAISDDGIITVKFPDGKLGMNATVVALTPESMKKQLETGKFKKGAHSREAFLTDVSLMGFNQ